MPGSSDLILHSRAGRSPCQRPPAEEELEDAADDRGLLFEDDGPPPRRRAEHEPRVRVVRGDPHRAVDDFGASGGEILENDPPGGTEVAREAARTRSWERHGYPAYELGVKKILNEIGITRNTDIPTSIDKLSETAHQQLVDCNAWPEVDTLLDSLLQLAVRAAADPGKALKLRAFADTLDFSPLPEPPADAASEAAAWSALGAELSALGRHRLRIAMRVARLFTTSEEVDAKEEERLVAWFRALLEEGIALTGGPETDTCGEGNPAAEAVWYLLVLDPRCPAMAGTPWPGDAGFVHGLVESAEGYLRAAIACSGEEEADELRAIAKAAPPGLRRYRPFGAFFGEHGPLDGAVRLEEARSLASLRHPDSEQLCLSLGAWARAHRALSVQHTIPPVHRIGAVAWLVHALRQAAGAGTAAALSDCERLPSSRGDGWADAGAADENAGT